MRSRDPRGAGPRGGLEIAPRYRGSGTAVWVGLGPSVRGAAARDVSTLLVRWTQRARGGRRQRRVQRPTGHAHGFRAHGVGFDCGSGRPRPGGIAGAGGVELQLGADSLKRSSNTWVSNSNAPRPRSRAPYMSLTKLSQLHSAFPRQESRCATKGGWKTRSRPWALSAGSRRPAVWRTRPRWRA